MAGRWASKAIPILVLLCLALGIAYSQVSISFSYSGVASVSANTPARYAISTSLYGKPPLSALASPSAYFKPPISALASPEATLKPPQKGCFEGPVIAYYVSNTTVDDTTSTVTYSTATQVYVWWCKTTATPMFIVDVDAPPETYVDQTVTITLKLIGGVASKYWELRIPGIGFYQNGTVEGTTLTFTVAFPATGTYDILAYGVDSAAQESSDQASVNVLQPPTTTTTTTTPTTATTTIAPTTEETTETIAPTTTTTTKTTLTAFTITIPVNTTTTEVAVTVEWPILPRMCNDLLLFLIVAVVMMLLMAVWRVVVEKPHGLYLAFYMLSAAIAVLAILFLAYTYACSPLSMVLAVVSVALLATALAYSLRRASEEYTVALEY
jgi:hypothetical protein